MLEEQKLNERSDEADDQREEEELSKGCWQGAARQ
jgi:hypothetical protein